jgi:inhibitor of cysteine peptidase
MPDTILTRADHETTVELQPGTTAVVELEENPTTGFRWAIEQPLPAGISLLDSDYAPGGDAVGGGGLRQFRLRADAPGSGVLSLKLWREWAGDASVVDRFRVTVRIRG